MKKWYQSKTEWLNLLFIIAIIVQAQTGYIITPEMQLAILGALNMVLRMITTEGIE